MILHGHELCGGYATVSSVWGIVSIYFIIIVVVGLLSQRGICGQQEDRIDGDINGF